MEQCLCVCEVFALLQIYTRKHSHEMTLLSVKLETNIGTVAANGLDVMAFSSRFVFESKPHPSGTEIETAGRASSVFEITAVARTGVKGS
mmetsp:Transcript_11557/g.24989  ORF Transcript_11557/g.24989 Transcript_11557/m.24989 type:complete len:90 (+) Transcript_11557:120-389(+)